MLSKNFQLQLLESSFSMIPKYQRNKNLRRLFFEISNGKNAEKIKIVHIDDVCHYRLD